MLDAADLAWLLLRAGNVEEAVTRARDFLEEGHRHGLGAVAAPSGMVLQELLMLQGRFAESEAMLEDLVTRGLESQWIGLSRASVLLARGEAEKAKPYVLRELEEEAELR